MKPTERPLLFNAPMVRATLDDSKTQTRRVAKLPHQNPLGEWEPTSIGGPNGGRLADGSTVPEQGAVWHTRTGDCLSCPYGQPGDRLWVRETFQPTFAPDVERDDTDWETGKGYQLRYTATDERVDWMDGDDNITRRCKPAIHMPRWASRIMLEIVSVRVERLQDISEEDAKAEGAWGPDDSIVGKVAKHFGCDVLAVHPSLAYRMLWESINGPGSWDVNPWVWMIEFKRVTP